MSVYINRRNDLSYVLARKYLSDVGESDKRNPLYLYFL